MNKPLILSLAAAAILSTNVSAASMYERFEAMEAEIASLKTEITDLKDNKSQYASDEQDESQYASDEDEDDEDDEGEDVEDDDSDYGAMASDDDEDDEDEAGDDEEDDEDDEESFEEETEDSLDYFDKAVTQLKKDTTGNHLKFSADLRSSVENMQYKMAADQITPDGNNGDTFGNDAFMANRLWLNMNWAASKHLSFTAQLAYNKAYGGRSGGFYPQNGSYETFDWITNENAYDGNLRVRSAYFFYRNSTFLGMNVPWTFSIGRRPSTNGHLINLRDDDRAASPSGHSINVEFDGLSSKFTLWEEMGTYVKFCAGRGLSNAQPRFSSTPYANNANDVQDIDLAGFIFVPYNDGQYELFTQFYYANNLIDAANPQDQTQGFQTVGGLYSGTASFIIEGIGTDWSDFTDDTTFFVSGAFSTTNPDKEYAHTNPQDGSTYMARGMLGSDKAETGYSVWVGLQTPAMFTDEGRLGFEYNWGSEYWRSITYGEDTNVGSKMAVRGSAYEAYYTQPLMEGLSFQLRYTLLDYDYTGSNGFFGDTTGRSVKLEQAVSEGWGGYAVDTAQDIRAYIRYRF